MNELRVSTSLTDTGVVQARDVFGKVTYIYIELCAKAMDEAIKQKLIEFGWTPPKEDVDDGI